MSRASNQAPPPIDKGWAWVVALAIFFERFFTVGITRSSGLFLLRLEDRYHVTTTYVGTALTLGLSIFAVGAPIATVLGESLTPRCLFVLGGVISMGAMTLGGLVGNLPTTIAMLGLAVGIVNSCSYGNGMVMIGKYFRVKRHMATNIALSGASIGQLVLPLVIEHLIETYGLSGALLICGALYLHCAVAGALLRPIDVTSYQRVDEDLHEKSEDDKYCTINERRDDQGAYDIETDDKWCTEILGKTKNGGARFYKKLKSGSSINDTMNNSSADITHLQELPSPSSNYNGKSREITTTTTTTTITATPPPSSSSLENQTQQNNLIIPEIVIQNDQNELFPLSQTDDDWNKALYGGNRASSRLTFDSLRRKSEDYSTAGNLLALKNGRRESIGSFTDDDGVKINSSCSSLNASYADLYYGQNYDDDDKNKSVNKRSNRKGKRFSLHSFSQNKINHNSKPLPKWRTFLSLVFDFTVLKHRVTVLFIAVIFFFYLAWYNFVFLQPGLVSDKGIVGFDKPIMISMIGLGDLLARGIIALGSSYYCHNNLFMNVQRYKLKATAAIVGSVNLALFIPASSFPQLVIHSFLHGLFGGLFECLLPGVLTDFVGVARMSQTLGVVLLFQGFGGALGQPLLGCLKDATGSYLIVCAICSSSLAVSCLLLLLYPLVKVKGEG